MTVAQARRALADAFRRAGLDSPELDARLLVGHALGLDHTGLTIEADRSLGGEEARDAGRACRAAARPRAGGAHPRRQGILGPAAARSTRPRWCRGRRPRPWSRQRSPRSTKAGRAAARCASPISAPARARSWSRCLTELPNATGIGTDISREALGGGARQRRPPRACTRARISRPAISARRWRGSFDLVGQQSALHRERRHRRACRPRSATIPAARSTAAPTASPAIAPLRDRRPGCSNPTGHLVVELGIGQEAAVAALFRAAGLAPSPARPDLAGIPRALHARVATMTP